MGRLISALLVVAFCTFLLVGCGGGIGGFLLALMLGNSKQLTGNFTTGLLIFACLCATALGGLFIVKARWRTTWGALSGASI